MDLSKLRNIKTPYILILIGPPLSGKSVFCKKFIGEIDSDVTIISRDQVILDVYGSDNYTDAFKNVDQKEVDRALINNIKKASVGNTIIDMTNLTTKRRKYNLSFFPNHYKVGVIFPLLEKEEYDRRNAKRLEEENKHIPHFVLTRMISSYTPIAEGEGFDKVISL